MAMMLIGAEQARRDLRRLLDLAAAGEEIGITRYSDPEPTAVLVSARFYRDAGDARRRLAELDRAPGPPAGAP